MAIMKSEVRNWVRWARIKSSKPRLDPKRQFPLLFYTRTSTLTFPIRSEISGEVQTRLSIFMFWHATGISALAAFSFFFSDSCSTFRFQRFHCSTRRFLDTQP